MDKPLTLIIQNFRLKLQNVINSSGLPAYVLLHELNDVAIQIQQKDNQIINQYNEEQEKKKQKEGDK